MFTCNHITILTADIERSHEFYVEKLGLSLLRRWPKMFAVRAGEVRLSISESTDAIQVEGNVRIVLRTASIKQAREEVTAKGIVLLEDIVEAPGFMRFFTLQDPDGNILHVGEYLRDPLVEAQ